MSLTASINLFFSHSPPALLKLPRFSQVFFLRSREAERVPAWQVQGALEIIVGSTGHNVTSLVTTGVVGVHGCRIHVASEG